MRKYPRLIIFSGLLLLSLAVVAVSLVALPVPFAGLPLGAGVALLMVDFITVLPWALAARQKDERPSWMGPDPFDLPDPPTPFPEYDGRPPFPGSPAEHWGQWDKRWHWDGK